MKNKHQALAEQVVQAFQNKLDPQVLERIGRAGFEDLRLLVEEALAESLGAALERVEVLMRELRAEAGKHEIEL